MIYSRLKKYSLIILFSIISCNRIDITWNLNKRPEVETNLVEVINGISVRCGGNIIDDGGSSVKEQGILYSLNKNPTLNDSVIVCGGGKDPFSAKITGLSPGAKYYLKAYAINEVGTGYGEVVDFTTVPYSLKTNPISLVTYTTARSGGNISSDGGELITSRGVCWSQSANPTINDSKTDDGKGKGSFISNISGLTPATTYHLRAYATNSIGTIYGNDLTFNTLNITLPTINTTTTSLVTSYSVKTGGTIISDGGSYITARGVCWNTTGNPTITDSKTNDGTGSGTFSSLMTGLQPITKYYFRAYATNSIGTAYGNLIYVTTYNNLPTLTTVEASSITSHSAKAGGNITYDGDSRVIERGVCWNTTGDPTISDTKTSSGTGSGTFSSLITDLQPNTKYYFRAFATNSKGTAYGNQLTFTTYSALPTVSTSAVSSITISSANSGGNITYDGYFPIIARGICWNTTGNPTISDNITNDGSDIGKYESSITGLQPLTRYYVRAYATNITGTTYGSQFSFFTHTSNTSIPTNGLIAYFPFNGNVIDESGNEINGTVFGPILTADRHGSTNSAYSFDGVNDYIKADATKLPSAERTLSLWFYANTVDNRPGLLGYGGNTGGTSLFMGLNVNGLKSFHLSCHYLANRIDYYYSSPPVKEWYHWVMITNSNGTKFYINGVVKASNSTYIKNTFVNGKQLGIGAIASTKGIVPYTDSNVKYFNGLIDDIRIYNRALTEVEIQALYHENGWKK